MSRRKKRSRSLSPAMTPANGRGEQRSDAEPVKKVKRDITPLRNRLSRRKRKKVHPEADEEIYLSTNCEDVDAENNIDETPDVEIQNVNSAVSPKPGVVVTVYNKSLMSAGWYDEAYEGAEGIVLSVFNTGNARASSTARVKFAQPLDASMDVLVVPVSFLWPVQPDDVGQTALGINGEHKGKVVKVREEVSVGWFVSAQYEHFEIESARLVKIKPVDEWRVLV